MLSKHHYPPFLYSVFLWLAVVSSGALANSNCDGPIRIIGEEAQVYARKNLEGGFVKNGERLFFVAPTADGARVMSKHLNVSPGSDYQVEGLPQWVGQEVTRSPRLLPKGIELQNVRSPFDGVRCYSAALLCKNYLSGSSDVSPVEMAIWMRSPLVREVSAPSGEKQTVVGVDRMSLIPLDHVATFVTDYVLFQKQGPESQFPFEFITRARFERDWPQERFKTRKYFEQQLTLENYLEQNRAVIDTELSKAVAEVKEMEMRMDPFLAPQPTSPLNYLALPLNQERWYLDQFDAVQEKTESQAGALRDLAYAKVKSLDPKLLDGKNPPKAAEVSERLKNPQVFLWFYVFHRARTLSKVPSPY